MINVKIIATGSLKEPYLRDAAAEYSKRLSAFCREHDLIMTGGTDFHGFYTKSPSPLGTCTTTDDQADLLKKRCGRYR